MMCSFSVRSTAARFGAALVAAATVVCTVGIVRADFSSMPLVPPAPGASVFAAPPSAPSRLPNAVKSSNTAQQPHPAVARIIVPERDGTSYGSGTLVDVTDSHGLVVTNWHVVENQTGPITVVFPDEFRSQATVVRHDPVWDLAALAIWKPTVAPVPIAAERPKPGEPLAIAGYGGGEYRMAAGRCTQYVAPGPRQPFEMVEVAAAARQGDSGGPIFNDRGELAGVLFGEGQGRTAGSDAGRVARFLAPIRGAAGTHLARLTVDRADAARAEGRWRAADDAPPPAHATPGFAPAPLVPSDPMEGRIAPSNLAPAPPASAESGHTVGGWSWPSAGTAAGGPSSSTAGGAPQPPSADARPSYPLPPAATATAPGSTSPDENAGGESVANVLGQTRFEQAKSILAIIGAIAIVVVLSKALTKG